MFYEMIDLIIIIQVTRLRLYSCVGSLAEVIVADKEDSERSSKDFIGGFCLFREETSLFSLKVSQRSVIRCLKCQWARMKRKSFLKPDSSL